MPLGFAILDFYLNSFLNDVQIVEKEVNMLDDYEDRIITPAMPPCMARFCCVLNFVISKQYTADYLVEQDYNVQFLNNVIINKTNVLLPQA
jgi:uncharacterized Fe-S cluster-containing radical SAM superfamily enzyme